MSIQDIASGISGKEISPQESIILSSESEGERIKKRFFYLYDFIFFFSQLVHLMTISGNVKVNLLTYFLCLIKLN